MKNFLEKYKINLIALPLAGLLLVIFFQNCGNIEVSNVVPDLTSKVSGITGQVCLANPNMVGNQNGEVPPAGNFTTLRKFYIIPLTSLIYAGSIAADSDVDGMADSLEIFSGAFGYNQQDRRAKGILDGLCYRRLGPSANSCATACTPTKSYFYEGINDCDVDSFNGNLDLKGLNMDAVDANSIDYMPDFIEALRGTSVAAIDVDGSSNSDLDSLDNELEIIQNSDPNDAGSSSDNQVSYTLQRDIVSACAGQVSYSFTIPAYVTLPVSSFNDGSELSHIQNENLAMVVVVSSSLQGKIQYQSYLMRVPHGSSNFSLEIQPQDFRFEGSY